MAGKLAPKLGMKVLINSSLPFALAHGGWQIQIEQTFAALRQNGVAVEYTRWADEAQQGDLIHYFGRMPADHVRLARLARRRGHL